MGTQADEPPPDPEPGGTVISHIRPVPVESGLIPWPLGADICPVPGTNFTLVAVPRTQNGKIVRHLGEGGEGIVFLAQSTDPTFRGGSLAIKFLPFHNAREDETIDAFLDDASALAREVDSTLLARTYQVCDLRAHPRWPPVAMVMEFFPCSLGDVVSAAQTWPVGLLLRQVVEWARQIAEGLDELHRKCKRVHRDIKPSNIMLRLAAGKNWLCGPKDLVGAEAVITDFGTLGQRDKLSPLVVSRGENDRWKHKDFYPPHRRPGDPPRGPQLCDPFMDIYAYGELLRVLDRLARGNNS